MLIFFWGWGRFLNIKNLLKPTVKNLTLLRIFILSCLFGFFWFIYFYGFSPLKVTNVNWVYTAGGDIFQHQIGWEWFRQETWHFPIGRIEGYGYPFGTSIAFLDSIPLMAIIFKIFSPVLNPDFQYMGLWVLLSTIFQFLFSMLLLGEFTTSFVNRILGASILVLSPIMITRAFEHSSLTAHWILLAAILYIILDYRHKLRRGAWFSLIALAMLIHIYFVVMLLPLWGVSLFFRYRDRKNPRILIINLYAMLALILLIGYAIGLFSLKPENLREVGFGYYSWNLNGFLNPDKYSAILKPLPTGTGGQYEGFSYLGLGNLVLIPIAIFFFLKKEDFRKLIPFLLPVLLTIQLFVFFAVSNIAYINDYLLWNIPIPRFFSNLFALFRSSGRFIWPVFYLIVLFGILTIIRDTRRSTIILLIAFIIQFIDLQPLFSAKYISNQNDFFSPFHSEFWKAAAATNKHIVLLPAIEAKEIYEPFALYARKNQLTLNWGYFSRADLPAINKYGDQVWENLKNGHADPQTIYLIWRDDWIKNAKEILPLNLMICQVDNYWVVLSKENSLQKELVFQSLCFPCRQ